MITIDRELFKQLAAGRYATLNQTYSKQDAEAFQSGSLWAYDLIMKSLTKPFDIKPQVEKVELSNEPVTE
jgi:hypothetical protein